ncbi:MAG TPA: hypothetical protein VN788_10780 [Verrucomicrobiae bacterium]|nr:hypothetical protein [Verrucomicrobiae bacterium]
MNIHFKLTTSMHRQILDDLRRTHPFAAERAAFIGCKPSRSRTGILLLAHTYIPLWDEQYVNDQRFGCVFNSEAMRNAMQFALQSDASMFHVHLHEHVGPAWFSRTDLRESQCFVPDFWNVKPQLPHGALVLSADAAAGLCWYPGQPIPARITQISSIGYPSRLLERLT